MLEAIASSIPVINTPVSSTPLSSIRARVSIDPLRWSHGRLYVEGSHILPVFL